MSKISLDRIYNYINAMLSDEEYRPGIATINHLNVILEIIQEADADPLDDMQTPEAREGMQKAFDATPEELGRAALVVVREAIISCDASIKENPGGLAAVAFTVELPGKPPLVISRKCPPNIDTNNKAEYTAIYEATAYLEANLFQIASCSDSVKIYSDSQLVVKQLNSEWACNEESLIEIRDSIKERLAALSAAFPDPTGYGVTGGITIEWKPRNSTPELKLANDAAQRELGVKPH